MQVHSGFWEGAKQHIEDIKQVVQQQNSQAHCRLPVWMTGHSLGGGYANCMVLHLLANKHTADLFSAGQFHVPAIVMARRDKTSIPALQACAQQPCAVPHILLLSVLHACFCAATGKHLSDHVCLMLATCTFVCIQLQSERSSPAVWLCNHGICKLGCAIIAVI